MSKTTSKNIEYVTLELGFPLTVATEVNNSLLFNNKIDTRFYQDQVTGYQIQQLNAFILQHSSPKTITYSTPSTAWQMFKRDYMPGWFNRRFPIINFVETVKISDIFPWPKQKINSMLIGDMVRVATVGRCLDRGINE